MTTNRPATVTIQRYPLSLELKLPEWCKNGYGLSMIGDQPILFRKKTPFVQVNGEWKQLKISTIHPLTTYVAYDEKF